MATTVNVKAFEKISISNQIALTGGQIAFPATAVPSADPNTLDDYEEGTWTPSVGGDATYTHQAGQYTKIGNVVTIQARLQINALGTGSTTQVSGLPFTVSDAVMGASTGCVSYFTSLAADAVWLAVYFNGGASTLRFVSTTVSGASSALGPVIFGNSAQVHFAGSYFTTE